MKISCTFLFVLISVYVFGQDYTPKSDGEIVNHTYYSLAYDEADEQARWVYYILTPSNINGDTKRTNDFRPDPDVSTQSAQLADYKGSGYDRGHLCPAGSMKQNKQAMSESFFMSNMSPQSPSFNRGIWKKLEGKVRNWTLEKEKLYVVSGPIFKDDLGAIGPNEVTIPGYYYKVIYSPLNDKMIAFILPNKKGEKELKKYAVTVDSIETLTGIDFFSQMDDKKEESLESSSSLCGWDF
jgi:endonuclease G